MNFIDKIVYLVGTSVVSLILYIIGFIIFGGGIQFLVNLYYKIKDFKKHENSKTAEYKTNNFKSNEEVANYIYKNSRTKFNLLKVTNYIYKNARIKFNLLDDIIKQSDIIKKYAYEDDYYILMAYMDIFTCYTIRVRKNYSEEDMNQILTSCFQMVSNSLTSNKYKISGNEMAKNYVEYVLPNFEFAIKGKDNSYLYMGLVFLSSVFNIQVDVLETNYHDVIEKVADLFMSIYIDEDIDLIK